MKERLIHAIFHPPLLHKGLLLLSFTLLIDDFGEGEMMKHFVMCALPYLMVWLLLLSGSVPGDVGGFMLVFDFLYRSGFFVDEPIPFPLHLV